MNNKGMLANLIGAFIAILIGVSLVPVIATKLNDITINENLTGTLEGTLLNFIPGFFALAVVGVAIAIAWTSLRNLGLVEDSSSELMEEIEKSEIKKPKNKHKQTYLEYVKERKMIERMMKI